MRTKKMAMLCLGIWATGSAYISQDTWKRAQSEGLLPENVRTKLDRFFHDHPEVTLLFSQEKYIVPSPWHGTIDPATAEQGGWTVTKRGYAYRTTPNTLYPNSYDETTQLWADRPYTEFFEESPQEERERRKKRSKVYDMIDEVLKPLNLKNETERGGNIVVSLHPYDIPYVVWGTWRAWTTYPQVASRYFTGRGIQYHLAAGGFTKIKVPNQYLYHVPGRLEDLTDSNWLVVSDAIDNQLSLADMRKMLVRMNILYVLADNQSAAQVTKQQMQQILDKTSEKAADDSCVGVFHRTIRELQAGTIAQAEIDDACACIREMHRFLAPEEGFLWKPLVQWDDELVNEAGDACIKEAAVVLARNPDGTHTLYLIDFEMPSIAGPKVDEERCMRFTGESDGLLKFAQYLQGDVHESWEFLTTVE